MSDAAQGRERVAERLEAVYARIRHACENAGRDPAGVRLVAVSKRQPADAIRAAYEAGHREFGENYVQEMVCKAPLLDDLPELRWRLIGRLQRNKAKHVVGVASAVDTVDSLPVAEALARRASVAGGRLEVLLQVNVAGEAQKAGCTPDDLAPLVDGVRRLPSLEVRGLMTVPPVAGDPEASRAPFRRLRDRARAHGLPELSMGMSHDLEVAIEEGATMVRAGTAVFGPRAS